MAHLRNSVLLLLRVFLLLALSTSIAFGSQWSEVNTGLTDTNIRVVAVDPTNPAVVYAGTPNGLYKSTDGGMLWSNIGLRRVESLAIDFLNADTVYAGTDGRQQGSLFKSTDGGMNWSNRRSPDTWDSTLLVMDPTDPKILYIGSLSGAVGAEDVFLQKTVDGGENWIEKTSFGIGLGCCTLAIDRNDPNTLYAPGTFWVGASPYVTGLFKSTDGGTSWIPTALTSRLTEGQGYWVHMVAMDPQNSNILYAATSAWARPGFTGLFKSVDGGTSWHPINTGLQDIGNVSWITALVIDPDESNVVYAATRGADSSIGKGVSKSVDGGKNWTVFNDGLGAFHIRSLALAPGSPNVLYAATPTGVFKIIDGPVVTLNENAYCVGSPWSLTVSNTGPETSVHLLGTSNNRSWEIPDWRKTALDGTRHETGVFATGTEGTHYLRVEVDGMLSNVVSFVVSNCRRLIPAYGP